MTPNLTLVLVASTLIGTGTYLLLSRSLVRALMGFLLMGNGINLIFIIGSGPAGDPPIVGIGDDTVDPVPQALVLTAIVITLAMTAFVLALAHRSVHAGFDLVGDDTESARIHARAEADALDEPTAREVIDQITADAEKPESRHHELEATATGDLTGSGVEPDEHHIPDLVEQLEVDAHDLSDPDLARADEQRED
ncbi:MAG: NADH-quinone oxidoreductase subunit K [Ornithinimicrobium sp.]|uniref:NADH-quinone oxidoreductase subunit K n=1 Tax=Ornithinimicrobium sp. TaxID=1977084 RepID=UPI0026E068E6|nr:NADH-quinone oxidoreductase subunit K [Ornithinimicrobium sp.]MDO5739125.1 NADH-quinone oxidoreductase subunit K [Ornithinimicrobium sp.]